MHQHHILPLHVCVSVKAASPPSYSVSETGNRHMSPCLGSLKLFPRLTASLNYSDALSALMEALMLAILPDNTTLLRS